MPMRSPHAQPALPETPLTYVVRGMTCSRCEAAVLSAIDEAGYDAVAA